MLWTRVRLNTAYGELLTRRCSSALQRLLELRDKGLAERVPSQAWAIHLSLANAYLQLDRYDEAAPYVEKAYGAPGVRGQASHLGACHLAAARLSLARKDQRQALKQLEDSMRCFDDDNSLEIGWRIRSSAATMLCERYAATGEFEQAYRLQRRYFDPIGNRPGSDVTIKSLGLLNGQPAAIKLSARELECIKWSAAGKTAWETGRILGVSEWTVVYHLERSKRKFGVGRKEELIAKATRLGLVNE